MQTVDKMYKKAIIQGHLTFRNERSYTQMKEVYRHRLENFYRSEILFNSDDVFQDETLTISIPKFNTQVEGNRWKHTIALLQHIAEFAITGKISAWILKDRKILEYYEIEPMGDKVAVQQYIKGRNLIEQPGAENEAVEALTKAIKKHERHAQAYERRGYVNFKMQNYDEAMDDLSKSIEIFPMQVDAYIVRGKLKIALGKHKSAISDFDFAIKNALPIQPEYWSARLLKADAHIGSDDYAGALLDLKLFCQREMRPHNPNLQWKRYAWYNYAKALSETENYDEALKALDTAQKIKEDNKKLSKVDILLLRGEVLRKMGRADFTGPWEEAAKAGSKAAKDLLLGLKD